MSDRLIREYYACFNDRRIADAAELFAREAVVEHLTAAPALRGGDAYKDFVDRWFRAFPDVQLRIEHVEQRGDTICEVDLVATGTHTGPFDLGAYGILSPTGATVTLTLRELLEIRHGKIAYAIVSFDIPHLVRQLTPVDVATLLEHLETIRQLTYDLASAAGDVERQREALDQLGSALDAARRLIRPQFIRALKRS